VWPATRVVPAMPLVAGIRGCHPTSRWFLASLGNCPSSRGRCIMIQRMCSSVPLLHASVVRSPRTRTSTPSPSALVRTRPSSLSSTHPRRSRLRAWMRRPALPTLVTPLVLAMLIPRTRKAAPHLRGRCKRARSTRSPRCCLRCDGRHVLSSTVQARTVPCPHTLLQSSES